MTGALAQPLAIGLALAGAAAYSFAAVAQQRAAASLDSGAAVDPALLIRLARRRRWLLSLVAVAAGYGFQAAALAVGKLIVVEPIFPIGLLFALMMAAHAEGRRLHRAEWTAAVAAVIGLAVFLAAAAPSGGYRTAGTGVLTLTAGGAVGVAAAAWLVATRVDKAHRALALAVGGGIGAGVTDALTKTVATLMGPDKFALFGDPRLYLLALVGLVTFTIQQNAFRAAGLAASLPAFAVLEPIIGSLLGLFVYHEGVGDDAGRIALEVAGVLAAAWGIIQLANHVIAATARLQPAAPAPAPAAPAPAAAQPAAAQPAAAQPAAAAPAAAPAPAPAPAAPAPAPAAPAPAVAHADGSHVAQPAAVLVRRTLWRVRRVTAEPPAVVPPSDPAV